MAEQKRFAFHISNIIGGNAIHRDVWACGVNYYEAAQQVVAKYPPYDGWYIARSAHL